jgi:tetratricopeptide (TPR) repeat protein
LGTVQVQTKRVVQGIAEYEQALALDRNLARAHAAIGIAKLSIGRGEETEAHVQEALRLSPRDTFAYQWMGFAGNAKLFLGKDDEATIRFQRVLEINRNHPLAHLLLAAALAHLNRLDEARSAVQAGLTLDPGFTLRRFRATALGDNPTYLVQRERVIEGLRKAGVPE